MHKRFVESIRLGQTFLARLMPGDDLFEQLREILFQEGGLERVVILSAIGSLREASFRDLKEGISLPVDLEKTHLIEREGPFEVLSLEGNVVPMEGNPVIHLHVLLGTPEGGVIGGHLFGGKVFSTLEIVFAEIIGPRVVKNRSEVTHLTEMRIGEGPLGCSGSGDRG